MAVTKGKNARTYSYDFWYNGVRFRGSTGAETEREARKVEARIRAELEKGESRALKRSEMSLREATGRFWVEKGQHEANARNVFAQLGNLVDGLGANTLLSRITSEKLLRYQMQQRDDRQVANRTINAEVPELISRVLKRAASWGVALPTIEERDWKALKLPVPASRIRVMTGDEEARFFKKLRADYHPIMRFAITTGLRRAALILRWEQIDLEEKVFWYVKKSKRTDNRGWLPLTRELEKIVRDQVGKHPEFVFTYVCARSRHERKKGEIYPVTYNGLRGAVEDAVRAAGLTDWRVLHDFRHTAATRTLRKSQNLRLVQAMLGHSDIAQTAKYAHAVLDDVRGAMETRSPKTPRNRAQKQNKS